MDAKPILSRFLEEDDFSAIAAAVATGYKACGTFMGNSPVTGTFQIGREQRPHLLRAFVEHSLFRLADTRSGFFQDVKPNAARNCHHLRLQKGGLIITAHYMGRRRYRRMARMALYKATLSLRNGDLFGYERDEVDAFADAGYAQILHGGHAGPELLMFVIPTRDQLGIAAQMALPISSADKVAAEVIEEEMKLKLKDQGIGEENDGRGERKEAG